MRSVGMPPDLLEAQHMSVMNTKALSCAVMFGALATTCLGFPPDFGPFAPGEEPTNTCVRKWNCATNGASSFIYRASAASAEYVRIDEGPSDEDRHLSMTIVSSNGQRLVSQAGIPGSHELPAHSVYSGLLNDDRIPDYVVRSDWGTGMGMLGWHHVVVFVLSTSRGGFAIVPIESWYADPEADLVDLNHDGSCEFIHTSFIEGGRRAEGDRPHNYWVHNLLKFRGTNCLSANGVDRRFPMWVWYKFQPNHEDDTLLSGSERGRLWKEQGGGQQSYGSFPMKSLLIEQIRRPDNGHVR